MDNETILSGSENKVIEKHSEEIFDEDSRKTLVDVLKKKALGYKSKEIIEEYVLDENDEKKLVKKKITRKVIPPDIQAVKLLLELYQTDTDINFDDLSDEEIEKRIKDITQKLSELGEQDDSSN
ncbi:MAG: hypothetical protein KBT30_02870 [Clostridiales bacterium]|nr:hypothetical protein [Candidatus Apopatousia equi]